MRKIFLYTLVVLFGLVSCKEETEKKAIKLRGNVFGTTYNITYTNTNINYQKPIDSLFYLVNKSLSTYIPTSDISKINKGDTTVVVDDMFIEVFEKAKKDI